MGSPRKQSFMPLFLPVALLLFAGAAFAQRVAPLAQAGREGVTIESPGHRAVLSLATGAIELTTPYHTYHLRVNIDNVGSWTQPAAATGRPDVRRDPDGVRVAVTYPVTRQREFVIELAAYRDLPGIYLLSRLRNLGETRSDYYYWYWEGGEDRCFVPGAGGPLEQKLDPRGSERLGAQAWVYLPGAGGGLAAFSAGTLGRGGRDMFLNALPNHQYISKGQSMDMGIGLAGVTTVTEAIKAGEALRGRKIPALEVKANLPELKLDYGRPAPAWARGIDKYNLFGSSVLPRDWTPAEIKAWCGGFPILSHVANDKGVIDRFHAAGHRVLMYLNFMEMLDSEVQQRAGARGRGYLEGNWGRIVDHENMDVARHRNWIAYDERGRAMQSVWGAQTGVPGLYSLCLFQGDLHQAVVEQAKKIMALGVDGIFIDNAAEIRDCHGDQFGKHTHGAPGRTNTEKYRILMKEVYDTVKSFGGDKVVMQNSGIIPGQWAYCDIQMAESAFYGSGVRARLSEWIDQQYVAQVNEEAMRHGKVAVHLNYFASQTDAERIPHALYTYAFTRFFDYGWADWFTLAGSRTNRADAIRKARELYDVRLGEARGGMREEGPGGAVKYRAYENGMVLANVGKTTATVTLGMGRDGELRDIGHDRTLTAHDGILKVDLAGDEGRVLVWQ